MFETVNLVAYLFIGPGGQFTDDHLSTVDVLRALPGLVIITGFIWATEALRLYFVVQALNFPGVQLGLSGAVC